MVKMSLVVSPRQYSSGLSPGTETSSRTFWSPLQKFEDLEATSEESKSGRNAFMGFIVVVQTFLGAT